MILYLVSLKAPPLPVTVFHSCLFLCWQCESRSGSVAVETFESTVIPAGLPNWKSSLL